MSEVDQNEAAPEGDVEEEAIFVKKEITVDMDQVANGIAPNPANVETADAEDEHSVLPVDDDRTEDQVPDITGTENVDPMTTSMDGIEDLPTNEETQEYGDTIMEEDEDDIIDVVSQPHSMETHKDINVDRYPAHADLPMLADDDIDEVIGDSEAAAVGGSAEQQVEESNNVVAEEPAHVEENFSQENPEGEAPPEEEKPMIELDTIAEAPAEEGASADEKPAVVEEGAEELKDADEQKAAPEGAPDDADAEKEFELQAPPEGKRPRTPNELDNPLNEEPVEEEPLKEEEVIEVPVGGSEEAAEERKLSQDLAPTSENLNSTPQTPKAEESVPETPKSTKTETATTPTKSGPTTPKIDESIDVPVTSEPATPKADEAPSTPAKSAPETPKTEEAFGTPTGSVPPTPKSATKEEFTTPAGSVPPTPHLVEEAPGTPAAGSVPPTPKESSQEPRVGSITATPRSSIGSTPVTPKPTSEATRKTSVPGTPSTKAETPKISTPALATPKTTGTPKSKAAFSFDETPATPKDKETPVKKTSRAGRTPKTPKTPKAKASTVEEPAPIIEETAEPAPQNESDAVAKEEPSPQAVENELEQDTTEQESKPTEGEPEGAEEEPKANEEEPEANEEEPKANEEEPKANEEEPKANEEEPEADEKQLTEENDTESAQVDEPPKEPVEEPQEEESKVERRAPVRARSPSPSPPRRTRQLSPSPERRPLRDYKSYDQDSHRQIPPPRIPTATSFSSWSPLDRSTYTPVSPFVTNPYKYRNEYTASSDYRPSNNYLSHFDDIVNTGAFSSALYSTTRLIERSRSRTRERRQAMRSQRSASNYYRLTSQYPAPQRAREYSTPPSREYSRPPSRSGSFISFMEYSGAKNGELSRNASRSSIHDSALALSRSSSRDIFYGGGRLSRVDSYVRDLHTPYEYEMPSSYDRYRSSSRSGGYSTISGYTSYNSSPYMDTDTTRRFKRYQYDTTPMVMSMYEGRIGQLERSLSRELLTKDRLRYEYNQLSSKLNQAMRQMDLLRSNSYSSIRSSSQPRTNVYTHFYPYY